MMKKLGSKLSSKSSGSQSTNSSFADSVFISGKSHHAAPGIPEFHRQEIPPHTLLELRLACAAIVKETGPSGAELEAILNQADPLEQYKKEEQHRKDIEKIRLQAARTHASAFPPVKGARDRDRLSKSNLESMNISTTSLVPQPVVKEAPPLKLLVPRAPKTQPIETAELESQTLQRSLSRKPVPGKDDEKPTRPRTQQDQYHGRTGQSSTSTTRSNTTHDHHASTNQTSFNHTPADNKRTSAQYPMRSSSRSQVVRGTRGDDASSMMSETDFFSPNPDYEVPSLYHVKGVPPSAIPSRARSRAGSIKDSIIGGIRDYIVPRPSMDRISRSQSRQSRSSTRDNSVTPSRSSSMTRNSKEWMRNAASSLRRRGSISSLRSTRTDDGERGRGKKDRGPDLNRKLPPLPGLDSYKEPKKHIAQLLARSKFTSKTSTDNSSSRDTRSPNGNSIGRPYTTMQPARSVPLISPDPHYTSMGLSNKLSPESTSSRQFPRIPFSDLDNDSNSAESPRRLRKHSTYLDTNQEDELRRVVREKIMQGGLSKEAFDAQNNRDSNGLGLLGRSHTVRPTAWDHGDDAAPAPTIGRSMNGNAGVMGKRKTEHRRSRSMQDGGLAPPGAGEQGGKKGFRGRFSRLMGHNRDGQVVVASH